MDSRVLEEAARTWREEGWVLIPSLIPEAEIDAAVEDLWASYPTPEGFHSGEPNGLRDRFYSYRDPALAFYPAPAEGPAFRYDQLLGLRPFPFPGSGALNRLLVHRNLLAIVRAALGEDDVRLYQAGLWAKYTGVANYEQPLHRDRNHSLLPARSEPGWWYMEGFIYLSDVGADCAPTHLVPASKADDAPRPDPALPHEAPELYAAEIPAIGPRGSYLAYRTDVWHRGIDLTRPEGARFVMSAGFKLPGQDWIGYTPLQTNFYDHYFQQFVAGSTPEELAVIGIPLPGHAVWTEASVEAFAAAYPALDVGPWRRALLDA